MSFFDMSHYIRGDIFINLALTSAQDPLRSLKRTASTESLCAAFGDCRDAVEYIWFLSSCFYICVCGGFDQNDPEQN